jgi:hypothetical protein
MPDAPEGVDLERPGSRFTTRVAVAVSSMHEYGDRAEAQEDGIARRAISEKLGPQALEPSPGFGEASPLDGSFGRGAESWIPVLEFLGVIGIGVLSSAAWDAIKAGIPQLRSLLQQAKDRDERVYVSRGAAAALAVQYVIEQGIEEDVLDVEAIEEPSALAGRAVTETSYTGFEPWLVSLLTSDRSTRYLVAIAPEGSVLDSMRLPVGELERHFLTLPVRDD